MGGSIPISLFDKEEDLHLFVKSEDDYVRDKRLESEESPRIQALLEPIWRFQSELTDAVEHLIHTGTLMKEVLCKAIHGTPDSLLEEDLSSSDHTHQRPKVHRFLSELAWGATLYLKFINKVRILEGKLRIFWKSTSTHVQEMLEEAFNENPDHEDPTEREIYLSKIQLVTEMATAMMDSMRTSLAYAQATLDITMTALKSIANNFYTNKIPLPSNPISRSFIMYYLHQIEQENMAETEDGQSEPKSVEM